MAKIAFRAEKQACVQKTGQKLLLERKNRVKSKKQGKNCTAGLPDGPKRKNQSKNCTARLSGILGRSFCGVFCQVVDAESGSLLAVFVDVGG